MQYRETGHQNISALLKEINRQKKVISKLENIKQEKMERVKELNCLYGLSQLIERHDSSLNKILQGLADLVPPSWQYPSITCARVLLEGAEYTSRNFRRSRWKQESDILLNGINSGKIEVYYLEKKPKIYEGPFLKEERMLIDELAERVSRHVERVNAKTELQERVKELKCLYGLAQLIDQHESSIDKILTGLVDLIPPSWQYPSCTCTRITIDGAEYTSRNYRSSKWKQTSDIMVDDQPVGKIAVYYTRKMPDIYEGPFLKEERLLIDELAERIGRFIEHSNAKKQLEVEKAALNNFNITLREVLTRVQSEKNEIGNSIQANFNKVILPIIHTLESGIQPHQKKYTSLLKANIEELTSPFVNRLSKNFTSLTPSEIQICNKIKRGISTKQIANIRGLSTATVNRHRENIRKKLRLTNKSVNLTTFLNTYMNEQKEEY